VKARGALDMAADQIAFADAVVAVDRYARQSS
jgi:hypothetical protein